MASQIIPFTLQAENATLSSNSPSGTQVRDADNPETPASGKVLDASGLRPGSTGGGYVDYGSGASSAGESVTFSFELTEAGVFDLHLRYASGGTGDRPLALSVNGVASGSLPFASTGTNETAWSNWQVQSIEAPLRVGTNTITLSIPSGSLTGPNLDALAVTAVGETPLFLEPQTEAFAVTREAEGFTITDADADSTARTTGGNPEPAATPSNSGPGLTYDDDGLWRNYEGAGYLDLGNDVGDSGSFQIVAPEDGIYQLTVRYALGAAAARSMTVVADGVSYAVSFPSTGSWSAWGEATIDVALGAGANTVALRNSTTSAPNIDNVRLTQADAREEIFYAPVAKINFQPAAGTGGLPAAFVTPAGFRADVGAAYGTRGDGLSYGWVTEASVADGTANGTTAAALPAGAAVYKGTVAEASDLQKTFAQFEAGGVARAWEMAVANGSYQVKVSIGDTAGDFDNLYALNIEGQAVMPDWTPANPGGRGGAGGGMRSTLVSAIANVTDGRLTIDSISGRNTEIQYLEIERIPELTPTNGQFASADYSYFTAPVANSLADGQVSIAIGANGQIPTGIDLTSTLVVGVVLRGQDYRGPNILHTDGVKLVETLTGVEVETTVQISGGADTLNVRPIEPLKASTSYTLKIEDVLDLGSFSDPNAPLRQMQDLTTTFVTGVEPPPPPPSSVAFVTDTLLDGFADGAGGFTTVEVGPDGRLYVATITGEIHRWSLNANGAIDEASKETLALSYFDAGGGERRGIIGLAFDPGDPETLWVTDNAPIPRASTSFNTPEFSGRVSKITLGDNLSFTGATAETYIRGLPRSGGDHVTNSIEFRDNPLAAQPGQPEHLLYLTQGSNSAAGESDPAWGGRPERLLNAAVLEIDPSRTVPVGGFDVRTEPVNPGDDPTRTFPAAQFNANGTYPGMYDPFAADAVLKLYATGVRNAYDLVWHSNGKLYVPTNGTAAGGRTPFDPTQPGLDTTIDYAPKQNDYLFTVDQGGYYGHPNELRKQYILNGGNPTSGADPFQVVNGADGNPATIGYPVGVRPTAGYDLNGVYSLGYNRSPNGAVEYESSVFGADFQGALIVAQFSVGDNLRALRLNASGAIVGDAVLRRPDGSVIDDYLDPLDITMNPSSGALYLVTLNRSTGASQLVLLTPSPGGGGAPLVTVQAEDRTPGDGTSVTLASGGGAQIVIRDAQNPQTPSGPGLVNGLHPGAFGSDGNTSNTDGVPGGYVDFGSTNADFMTFRFNAPDSGPAILTFRYANGGGADRPLQLAVNDVVISTVSFPATASFGDWRTVEVAANLVDGVNSVTLRSVANTGPNIDQLQVRTTDGTSGPGTPDPNADIAVQSLDGAFFDDRLQFSFLQNPNQSGVVRDFKGEAEVRISNEGTAPLRFSDAIIDGPFVLADPDVFEGLTLAAGAAINVEVRFDRSKYTAPTTNIDSTSTVFNGALRLLTNDADSPTTEIDLSGFWQNQWENRQEPNVNEVWRVFGFGNRIEGLSTFNGGGNSALSRNGVYAKYDDTEILSPYWQIADGVTTARATQIAAFHGPGQALVAAHAPGSVSTDFDLWRHDGLDNQRLLPNIAGSATAASTRTLTRANIPDAWQGDDVFGIGIAGVSSDPRLNSVGSVIVAGAQQGHSVKMFQAYDAAGNILPDVYLAIMDYPGMNYDFNDNMIVFEGIKPVGVGPTAPLANSYPAPAGTPTSDLMAAASVWSGGDALL